MKFFIFVQSSFTPYGVLKHKSIIGVCFSLLIMHILWGNISKLNVSMNSNSENNGDFDCPPVRLLNEYIPL